jgi:predicted Zn-ribbon and HTH transcriptional regulator
MDIEEQILQEYIKGKRTGGDNQLRAVIGSINAKSTKKLSEEISNLHRQIPITISELRDNLSRQANKIIEANKKIADSNSRYAKALKVLEANYNWCSYRFYPLHFRLELKYDFTR